MTGSDQPSARMWCSVSSRRWRSSPSAMQRAAQQRRAREVEAPPALLGGQRLGARASRPRVAQVDLAPRRPHGAAPMSCTTWPSARWRKRRAQRRVALPAARRTAARSRCGVERPAQVDALLDEVDVLRRPRRPARGSSRPSCSAVAGSTSSSSGTAASKSSTSSWSSARTGSPTACARRRRAAAAWACSPPSASVHSSASAAISVLAEDAPTATRRPCSAAARPRRRARRRRRRARAPSASADRARRRAAARRAPASTACRPATAKRPR